MASLYVISTPIGNLEDITLRAIKVLETADIIFSENPSTTKKLLLKYHINTPLKKLSEHSPQKITQEVIDRLKKDEQLAYVSEAGTPGISDPGGKLIQEILRKLPSTEIVPLPGPSALTTILSISGFKANRFLFLGFLPKKRKRQKFLTMIKESLFPVVCYESVYRIEKFLQELNKLDITELVVGRELTKKFETVYRGSPEEVLKQLKQDKIKGEFVIAINR